MHAARSPVPWTAEEYLEREERSVEKNELIDGQIYAMAGASFAHNRIAANVIAGLHALVRQRGCQVNTSDLRIHVPATGLFTYPDASIICGKPEFLPKRPGRKTDTLLNPVLLVEVLSPSTEEYDRGQKFADYRSILSLKEVLFVAQHEPWIEHHRRIEPDQWLRTERRAGSIDLPALDGALTLDEIYENVELAPEQS